MRRLLALIRRAYAVRATRRTLAGLSDHMLRDLGLTREQIRTLKLF